MSAANDGGRAFPCDSILERDSKGKYHGVEVSSGGMSLRDYFAAKAMQAHVTAQWAQHYATKPGEEVVNCWDDPYVAACAYDMADTMMKAR